MTRIIVTGLTGNLGTALLRKVVAGHPDWSVTGIARRLPNTDSEPYSAAQWHEADLGRSTAAERDDLVSLFRGADAVVHLAWALQPSHRPEVMTATNIEGSRNVFDAAVRAKVPHLVHTSSLGAYSPFPGRPKVPVREDWPTGGIKSSLYSMHKVTAERMLDDLEAESGAPIVTRMRPGLVLQGAAAAAFGRYFLGALSPAARLLPRLPVLPIPNGLLGSAAHADDIADAIVRIVDQVPGGAFNLAAEPPLDSDAVARGLSAWRLPVPFTVSRAVTDLSWRLHVQPTDVGWLDIANQSPILDSTRARTLLGWQPQRDPLDALAEVAAQLKGGSGPDSPVLAGRP